MPYPKKANSSDAAGSAGWERQRWRTVIRRRFAEIVRRAARRSSWDDGMARHFIRAHLRLMLIRQPRRRVELLRRLAATRKRLPYQAYFVLLHGLARALDEILRRELRGAELLHARNRLHRQLIRHAGLQVDHVLGRLQRELGVLEQRAHAYEARIAELEALCMTDPLTGAGNRRRLESALSAALAFSQRSRAPLSVLYLDIDSFKAINDRHGHLVGDAVLRNVSAALQAAMRGCDSLFRYGGDEFCALLPNTDAAEARRLCERIVNVVTRHVPGVTVSIGVAEADPGTVSTRDLLAQADRLMYEAKQRAGFSIETGHLRERDAPDSDE